MSAQEILTRYGSYFEGQNLILTGLRELFYLVLSFLYSFIKGCGDLLSKAYNVLTFDTQSRVNEIFGGALSTEFLTAVVLIVVVCIGIAFILNSNSIKGSKIIQNIMFGLLVVFILPTFINSVNGIIASSDMGNISTSSVNKIFSANIVDLKYCFGGDTVIDPTGEVHNGFPDDYDYSLLPMDELIKGSETPGIDDVFTKTLLNRGSVDEELGECSSGEIFGNFISFLSSYYYRYKVDMFPIFLSEIATILVMVFTFFKVVRLCYELIVNHFFAYIFAITDIASGAKLREALKSILSTYVVLIYCSVAISLFNTFQAWIFDSSIFNNFEASICIIPVAMAVIDGPNLIERLFGIDAGIKSGFHTAMGLMHAGKTALGMGKAAWNLGKDVTGAKTPLDKARAVRQSELGNYGATHARGNDLETGGRGVADKKEKNGNANEMPHRRGEASTTGSVPNVKTERNPFNAESQNTQSDKEPLNEEKNSGQNSWSFAEPEEMHKVPIYDYILREMETQLENVQETRTDRQYYILLFAESQDDYFYALSRISQTLIYNDLARKMSLPAKLAVLEKLNNKSQTIQVQNATKVNITYPEKMTDVQIRQKIEKLGYDPWLLEAIQPKGGLRPVNERYIETGCGYEACITVSKFPARVEEFWLTRLMNMDNIVCVIDINAEQLKS